MKRLWFALSVVFLRNPAQWFNIGGCAAVMIVSLLTLRESTWSAFWCWLYCSVVQFTGLIWVALQCFESKRARLQLRAEGAWFSAQMDAVIAEMWDTPEWDLERLEALQARGRELCARHEREIGVFEKRTRIGVKVGRT